MKLVARRVNHFCVWDRGSAVKWDVYFPPVVAPPATHRVLVNERDADLWKQKAYWLCPPFKPNIKTAKFFVEKFIGETASQ